LFEGKKKKVKNGGWASAWQKQDETDVGQKRGEQRGTENGGWFGVLQKEGTISWKSVWSKGLTNDRNTEGRKPDRHATFAEEKTSESKYDIAHVVFIKRSKKTPESSGGKKKWGGVT